MSIPRFKDTGSENVTKIYFVGHSGTKESGLILAIRTKKGILSDRMASKNGTKVQVQDSTEVTADHLLVGLQAALPPTTRVCCTVLAKSE